MMRISSLSCRAALVIAVCCVPALAQQNTGYLKAKVDPGRAGVFVDGKYVGPAANFKMVRKYAVAPGEHEIRLVEPRYEEVVKKVTVEAGKTVHLSETMKAVAPGQPPFGELRTSAPDKFSAVYVDGRFMGHAGEFNNRVQGLLLNPGTYKVKIVPPGGGEGHEEQVTIEANKKTFVRAK
jgi:hypothetical protein